MDEDTYRSLIADNIQLTSLLDVAKRQADADTEIKMVQEIYEVICQMVTIHRDVVVIKNTEYPWEMVKSQYLKLRYGHICNVLNRIVDANLHITNMESYLIA